MLTAPKTNPPCARIRAQAICAALALGFMALHVPCTHAAEGIRQQAGTTEQKQLCFEAFANLPRQGKITRDLSSPHGYKVTEKMGVNKFYLEGELTEYGGLFFSIKLRAGKGYRSSLKGQTEYDKMIQHFGRKRIKFVAAQWLPPRDGHPSDNYTHFMQAFRKATQTSGGDKAAIIAAVKESVRDTWSYRMAARHGYTEVEIMNLEELMQSGDPDQIDLVFDRPNSPARNVYEQFFDKTVKKPETDELDMPRESDGY